jgi:hypothetical protein
LVSGLIIFSSNFRAKSRIRLYEDVRLYKIEKISSPVKNIQHLSRRFSNSEKEECIDAKLALVDENGEPVQWDESFRDIGSAQARQWNEKFAAALPELHFISNNIICFVEVGAIKYTEFNDQVIMESRLTIMSSQGRKISSSQIKSYVHEIIDKIKILADPEFANRVTSKFVKTTKLLNYRTAVAVLVSLPSKLY